ncbi:F-box domain-containing protein [Brazilian cedratvirus IHUMI]|uniref:F-box domain-containing protein n=1 Tax=Brazilian cedratvirus IHUMI TaxID=2126980 RepID=A0A2R8FCS6_9VIRU|nr:F-box domain-containing protein [Brazilian cedratvirus IHUMI]
MDLPLELNYKILLDLPVLDLENVCSTSTSAASFCSDATFWRDRFRREGLLLPRDESSVPSWTLEYKLSKIAQLRERHYTNSLLAKHVIILDLTRVNDVSILPGFLNKVEFALIRDKRALQKNLSTRPRKMLLLNREDKIKLDVGEGLQIDLTPEQARVLLYIFCYYELDPLTDRERETYRVPRSQLEELGLVKPVPLYI